MRPFNEDHWAVIITKVKKGGGQTYIYQQAQGILKAKLPVFGLRLHIAVIVLTLAPESMKQWHPSAMHKTYPPNSLPWEVTRVFIKTECQKKKKRKTWKSGNNEFHIVLKVTSQVLQEKIPKYQPWSGPEARIGIGWTSQGTMHVSKRINGICCWCWYMGLTVEPSWCRIHAPPVSAPHNKIDRILDLTYWEKVHFVDDFENNWN